MRRWTCSLMMVLVAGCNRDFSLPVVSDIAIVLPKTEVAPNETMTVTAQGGRAPYAWSLVEDRSGGASIDAATGSFQAGIVGEATDRIRVVDADRSEAFADIEIGDPLALTPAKVSATPDTAIELLVQGGLPPYRVWLVPNGTSCDDPPDPAWEPPIQGRTLELPDEAGRISYAPPQPQLSPDSTPLPWGYYEYDADFLPNDSLLSCELHSDWTYGELVCVQDATGERVATQVEVAAPLQVSVASTKAVIGVPNQLTAKDGTPPYRYELLANRSGGTLDRNGAYVPGFGERALDRIRVFDATGAQCWIDMPFIDAPGLPSGPAQSVVVGDLDGDGNADVVTAEPFGSNGTRIWVGFSRPFELTQGSEYIDVRSLELVAAPPVLPGGRSVIVVRNNDNSGDFFITPGNTGTLEVESVLMDDVLSVHSLGDGKGWIAVGMQSGCTGLFTYRWPANSAEAESTCVEVRSGSVADFDEDGSLDVATVDPVTGRLVLTWGPASKPPVTTSIAVPAGAVSEIVVADIDGDGRVDVLIIQRNRTNILPVFVDTNRRLEVRAMLTISRGTERASSPSPIWITGVAQRSTLLYRDGFDLYRAAFDGQNWSTPLLLRSLPFPPTALSFGDLNGDRADDAVAVGPSTTAFVMFGTGDGEYAQIPRFGPGVASAVANIGRVYPWDIAPKDATAANGPHDEDVIAVDGTALRVLAGEFSTLTHVGRYDGGLHGDLVQLRDLDGDGYLDALRNHPDVLWVQRGVEEGFERDNPILLDFNVGHELLPADFDGDGVESDFVVVPSGNIAMPDVKIVLVPEMMVRGRFNGNFPVAGGCELVVTRRTLDTKDHLLIVCGDQVHYGAVDVGTGSIDWSVGAWTLSSSGSVRPLTAVGDFLVLTERNPTDPRSSKLVIIDPAGNQTVAYPNFQVLAALAIDANADGRDELMLATTRSLLVGFDIESDGTLTWIYGFPHPGVPLGPIKLRRCACPHVVVRNGLETMIIGPESFGAAAGVCGCQ